MNRIVALPGLILLTLASGCFYELRDELAEQRIYYMNRWAAQSAWENSRDSCMGMCCPHSFKEGFMAGYIAIANGSNGCLPAIPKIECCNHMWMDHCSENDKMQAWYDGYEIGVIAARGDGMADVNRITTRIPQPQQIDFSGLNGTTNPPPAGTAPDSAVPPMPTPATPAPQPGYGEGPQTIYLRQTNATGSSSTANNAF